MTSLEGSESPDGGWSDEEVQAASSGGTESDAWGVVACSPTSAHRPRREDSSDEWDAEAAAGASDNDDQQ